VIQEDRFPAYSPSLLQKQQPRPGKVENARRRAAFRQPARLSSSSGPAPPGLCRQWPDRKMMKGCRGRPTGIRVTGYSGKFRIGRRPSRPRSWLQTDRGSASGRTTRFSSRLLTPFPVAARASLFAQRRARQRHDDMNAGGVVCAASARGRVSNDLAGLAPLLQPFLLHQRLAGERFQTFDKAG